MLIIEEKEFIILTDYIHQNYGINLSRKKNLIEGRLSNIIVEKGLNSFAEYISLVLSDISGTEATLLINKLTTNHTFFMREAKHFEFFKDRVLPFLISRVKEKDLRIWSAGCSTGEEPYTLAILLQEFLQDKKAFWDTKILATDISVKVLDIAEKGIYPEEAVNQLSYLHKLQYFQKMKDGSFKISEEIRKEVIFRVFNLMDSFPFKKKFHTIFCRNVMIYFDQKTKIELIRKFYDYTEPGGYLFIGHSETIPRETMGYEYIQPAVYRKEMQ